ncbi:MAG: hypothetical protein R6V58_00115 [Planctomycetota bacterium]
MRYWMWIVALLLAVPAVARAGDDPGALIPGGEGVEGEEEAELPNVHTVKVSARVDRLVLTDGSVVRGSIVAVGAKAVIIATAAGEQTVPRGKIEQIRRAPAGAPSVPRTFETEIDSGHERIVVPPGLEEEVTGAEATPRGVGSRVAEKVIDLAYKPEKGQEITVDLDIATRRYEEWGAAEARGRDERVQVRVKPTVGSVQGDGSWTVRASYELKALFRGYANVTALHEQKVGEVSVVRRLSPDGIWKPGSDAIRGAAATDRRFFQWLNYFTVPLPAEPVVFDSPLELKELMPAALARALLPPPKGVSAPGWKVTGTYVVEGTQEVDGIRCARVSMKLEGRGAGAGRYEGAPADVDVAAQSAWTVFFDIDAGRPFRSNVKTSAVATVGGRGGQEIKLKTDRWVEATVAGPRPKPRPTPEPEKKTEPAEPAREKNIEEDLDDLMKKLGGEKVEKKADEGEKTKGPENRGGNKEAP